LFWFSNLTVFDRDEISFQSNTTAVNIVLMNQQTALYQIAFAIYGFFTRCTTTKSAWCGLVNNQNQEDFYRIGNFVTTFRLFQIRRMVMMNGFTYSPTKWMTFTSFHVFQASQMDQLGSIQFALNMNVLFW